MSGGRHHAPEHEDRAGKPVPPGPIIQPDPQDPRYDDPSTFGKGWRR